jgi:uncharacterized membrane protein
MSRWRAWPRRILLVLLTGPALLHLALSGTAGEADAGRWLDVGLIAASGLPHALIYAALLVIFAATLRRGRDPLVTALSRRMYAVVPEEMAVYTRRVTWAWCAFFVAQLATSLALFLFAPVVVWSFFVNVLNLPLLALMFIAEHTCRPFLLRNAPRHSLDDVRRIITYLKDGLLGARIG